MPWTSVSSPCPSPHVLSPPSKHPKGKSQVQGTIYGITHAKMKKICTKNEWKNVLNIHQGQMLNLFHQLHGSKTPQGLFVLQPGFIVFDFNLCLAKWWKDVESISCCKPIYSSVISLGRPMFKKVCPSSFLLAVSIYPGYLWLPVALSALGALTIDSTSKVFRISPCEAMSSMYPSHRFTSYSSLIAPKASISLSL